MDKQFLLLHVLLPMHRLSGLKTTPEGRPAQSPSRLGNDSYFGQPSGRPAKATSKSAGTSLTARPHSGIDTLKRPSIKGKKESLSRKTLLSLLDLELIWSIVLEKNLQRVVTSG